MYPQRIAQTLFDAQTPVAVTSSTDATPIVVTATSHGLKTGNRVIIQGHTTNIAANGTFIVGAVTTNTFSLTDEITGASVAGSGAGAGSGGLCMVAAPVQHIGDFRNMLLQVGTTGSATMTLKVYGSLGKTNNSSTAPRGSYPNFGATIAPSNPQSPLQLIDLDTGAALNGSTGIVIAGTDINKMYEINTNLMIFATLFPVTWTQGAVTAKITVQSPA